MDLFHRHTWEEAKRYFVPPLHKGKWETTGFWETYEIKQLLNGYTVIELRCSECGKLASETLLGDAT